ncbi:MAG: YfiR family protein [Candidatus Binataceae bacterium]|nr:YfiR family protein [Candidatus Binataceae bacterium]
MAFVLGAIALCLWAEYASAEETAVGLEERVKAAFLYKFGNYVEWPKDAFARDDSPVVIGVAGDEAVADELAQAVAGRKLGNRPVEVLRLAPGDPLDHVNILFIGRDSRAGGAELMARARSLPVLTVTESDDAQPPNSVINFVVVDNHVRFEIFLDAAARHRLKLASALLAVAREVHGGRQ